MKRIIILAAFAVFIISQRAEASALEVLNCEAPTQITVTTSDKPHECDGDTGAVREFSGAGGAGNLTVFMANALCGSAEVTFVIQEDMRNKDRLFLEFNTAFIMGSSFEAFVGMPPDPFVAAGAGTRCENIDGSRRSYFDLREISIMRSTDESDPDD